MVDELPTSFDAIVVGTGLTESIVASSLSRIGKTVLHIDRNAYYGSRWASFSLRNLKTWKEKTELKPDDSNSSVDIKSHLQEGESFVLLPSRDEGYSDIQISYHNISSGECDDSTDSTDKGIIKTEQSQPVSNIHDDQSTKDGENNTENADIGILNKINDGEKEGHEKEQIDKEPVKESDEPKESDIKTTSEKTSENDTINKRGREKWTIKKLEDQWRRFNFDMSPKVLYCNGDMVQLLIQSDISRYCEFKLVSRILTIFQNELKSVPCSRAHIFNSKEVTMLEKRIMMKFVKACLEDNLDEAMNEYLERPFSEYLEEKFSPIARHYIYQGISMANKSTTTKEGISLSRKFFASVGKYGDIPFITSIYGVGELPQAFSRMCAVWGGIYCLNLSAEAIIISEGKAKAVITSDGKRIECEWLILEPSYIPDDTIESVDSQMVNRAVLVTDQPLLQSSKEELSLLNIYPPDDTARPTVMLEYPPSSMVCPSGLCLIHLTRQGKASSKTELDYTCKYLFNFEDTDEDKKDNNCVSEDSGKDGNTRPNVLWSLFFQVKCQQNVKLNPSLPSNILVTSQPGTEVDLDFYPKEAKRIFELMYPDEEFHPKCPHPEDIIYCPEEDKDAVSDGGGDACKQESDGNTTTTDSPCPNTTSNPTPISDNLDTDTTTTTTIESISEMKLED
ncbi:rab proteins geranylgeranyltransferase component A-like [Argonauta hians]